ncbi:MAG: sporulation integral membrane protein YtvI [Bacillota bacterium]|nr:sporulation integral membrane protein YtvI [Bacillota bacterium]
MPENKQHRFLLSLLYLALIFFGGYFFIKYLLGLFMPFIVAYLLSRVIEPVVRALNERLRIPRDLACAICTILVTAIFGLLLYILSSMAIAQITNLSKDLPAFLASLPEKFELFVNRALRSLTVESRARIIDMFNSLVSDITVPSSTYTNILTRLGRAASSVPTVIITTVAIIVSTYFFASSRNEISRFIKKQLPPKWLEAYSRLKVHLFRVLGRWLKAQLILFSITFAELTVAFIILKINYAGIIAFLTAIIDILPVFGVGTVLIPWGIIEVLSGNFSMGISLIVLYGIVILIRNTIEPKIVGQQIGLPPLVTLVSMYFGFRLFGVLGMFLVPLFIIILIRLNEWDYIHIWKN